MKEAIPYILLGIFIICFYLVQSPNDKVAKVADKIGSYTMLILVIAPFIGLAVILVFLALILLGII